MTTSNLKNLRKHYEEIVKRPGKFEGEQPYVPYFWDTEDCDFEETAQSGLGMLYGYKVIEEDVKLFPELANIVRVYLMETDQGFVMLSSTVSKSA